MSLATNAIICYKRVAGELTGGTRRNTVPIRVANRLEENMAKRVDDVEIVEILIRSKLLLNALLGAMPPKKQETTWKNIVRKTRELIADIQNILPEEK